MAKKTITVEDPEIIAISAVFGALKDLESDAQKRVLAYVAGKLKIPAEGSVHLTDEEPVPLLRGVDSSETNASLPDSESEEGDLEGVSPVAKKWMARNGFTVSGLSNLFSLGVDEIDLVAKTVPGKNKKERMRSVFLLKGIAAYLSAGAARFTHEQWKETALHYDAFDATNFAAYFKSLAGEVSGSKDSGYVLSARGLASATEMVKQLAGKQG